MPTSSKSEPPAFSLDPIDNVIKHLHAAAQSAAEWNDYWQGLRNEPPSPKLSYHIHPDDSRLFGTLKRMFRRNTIYATERLKTIALAFHPLRDQLERFASAQACNAVEATFLQLLRADPSTRYQAVEGLRVSMKTILAMVIEREKSPESTKHARQLQKATEGTTRTKGGKRDKDWRQEDAARLAHVSVRELRRWDKGENTPADYPGWRNAVLFKAWINAREGKSRLNRALKNHVSYQEGVTEKYRGK